MAPYKYSPLNEAAKEIRLLTLPGKNNSRILSVLIHTVSLTPESVPTFEALSYTWGSAKDPIDIQVGSAGHEALAITQNLATALQYLQYYDKPRTLWIDAICVDQQNLKERGHQVERMGDIYRSANRVVVWLGPEGDDSAYALKLINDLSLKIEVDWLAAKMKPSLQGESDPQWCDQTKLLPYEDRELLALCSLLDRSWFERLWIRQEIRLANRNAIVMCGYDIIPWQSFRSAIFCLRNKAKKRELLGSRIISFHERIEMIYQMSDDATYVPFGRLIRQTTRSKCSDPRDRIYALQSILDDSEKGLDIKPDYSKTTSQVYQEVVIRYISHFKTLKLLASCEMSIEPTDMPSWVPNWAIGNIADPLWFGLASGDSDAQAEHIEPGILRCAGVQSATIRHAHQIKFVNTSNPELIAGIREPAPPDILHAPYVSGGSMFDAYCRTLCCDNFADFYSPTVPHFPIWQHSQAALRDFLDPHVELSPVLTPGIGAFKYLDFVWNFCKGRSFFTTEEGYIGLGPRAAKEGDKVFVFLGSGTPLLLRPIEKDQYQLVGECYCFGLMNAEALIGPLPQQYRPCLLFDEDSKRHVSAYLDNETGNIQTDDPRLKRYKIESDAAEITAGTNLEGPKLTPEFLQKIGVSLQFVDLV